MGSIPCSSPTPARLGDAWGHQHVALGHHVPTTEPGHNLASSAACCRTAGRGENSEHEGERAPEPSLLFFMGKQLRPAACSGRGKSWDISDSPQPVSLAVSALSFCDTLQQRPHTARWPQDAFFASTKFPLGKEQDTHPCFPGGEREGRIVRLSFHWRGCPDHICIHFHEIPIKVTNRTQSAN